MLGKTAHARGTGADWSRHRVLSLQGDVTKKEDLKRIVDEIKKEHEGIHILVNNVSQTSLLYEDHSR